MCYSHRNADNVLLCGVVQISSHRVIYHLLEEVRAWTQVMTPKVEKEVVLGEADVLQVIYGHPAASSL